MHLPFCRAKCAYCSYHSVPLRGRASLDVYLDYAVGQMDFLRRTFSRREFDTLYVGGGTPSLLSVAQMERLLGALFERFRFADAHNERTFECNPDSVDRAKIGLLKRYGFTRISMGVQSLGAGPLKRANRGYQTRSSVIDAVGTIRKAGGLVLNLDLLLGLPGDDKMSFLKTFEAVAALKPEQITVYRIEPTPGFLAEFHRGDGSRFNAHLRQAFAGAAEEVPAVAARYGYDPPGRLSLEQHSWTFGRDPGEEFEVDYDDVSDRHFSILGIGPSTRSRVSGHTAYRQGEAWSVPFDPRKAACRGRDLSWKDEMAKHVFTRVFEGEPVSRREFRRLFGRDVSKVFAPAIASLRRMGWVRSDGDLLRVLPESNRERFAAALRFMDPSRLDDMEASDIRLEAGGRSVGLRIESLRAGENYLASAAGRGLRIDADPARLLGPDELKRFLELIATLFIGAALRHRTEGIPAIARRYRESLAGALKRLHESGFFRGVRLEG